MVRLHSLQVFCRVIDCQGFAAAARDMGLSPSVVTRLITELEAQVGARLIHRTTRRLVLTDAGEAYLEQVRRILAELEDAEAAVRSNTQSLSGELKVLAPPAFAAYQLAPLLPGFRRRYPKLTVGLVAPGMVESLDENFDISLIIARTGLVGGDFIARRLTKSSVILCASPDYLAQYGRPQEPKDLATHEVMTPTFVREMVLRTEPGAPFAADPYRITPQHSPLVTEHTGVALSAALSGLGIAAVPSYAVANELSQRKLERVLPGWHLFEMTIYAAMPSRKFVPAKTRAFLDYLLEVFASDDRDPWLDSQAQVPS